MNTFKKTFTIAVLFASASLASSALLAQTATPGKGTEMSSGEVRKVDKDAKKITLKHGEIKNIGMPPMTMVFQVKDPAMLDKVKTGDKVSFSVEKRDSALVVTAIEVAK